MTNRVVDIAELPAFVHLRNGLLEVRPLNQNPVSIPLADVAVLMASNRELTISQAALAALAGAGAIFVCCDEKHLPAGMLLPLNAHSTQAERYRKQVAASLPTRKRLWQELIRAKLLAQAAVLRDVRSDDAGLGALSARVRSGDAGNLEAVAAQRYWTRLFDNPLRRGDEMDTRNHLLNYGYAVLRAACCRALCAAGLHPTFGVHHANRYDCFALADDFMEPMRPLIDRAVVAICNSRPQEAWAVDRTTKPALIGTIAARYRVEGESRTLFDILARAASDFAARLTGEAQTFTFPDINAA